MYLKRVGSNFLLTVLIDVLKGYPMHQVFSDTKVETELRLEVA